MKVLIRIFCLPLLVLCSCNTIRYLPHDNYFHDDTEVIINNARTHKEKKAIKRLLIENIPLRTNNKVFGSRPGVWFYFKAGNPAEHATIKQFMKTTLGSPPIFLSDVRPLILKRWITNELATRGYFRSAVSYKIDLDKKKRSSKITFFVTPGPPYFLRDIEGDLQSDSIYSEIAKKLRYKPDIKTGQQYNLKKLTEEIVNIERTVKNDGYFYFNGRYLIFEADTTVGDHGVDLTLTTQNSIPQKAKITYRLNPPVIHFHNGTTIDSTIRTKDSVLMRDVSIIYSGKNTNQVDPEVLAQTNLLRMNDTYSLFPDEATRQRFMDLGIFQSIVIRYSPSLHDSARLIPDIFLSTRAKKNVNTKLEFVSKSNGTIGPVAAISFTNRNLLGGAEKFDVSLSGAYETQISNSSGASLNAFEVKLESALNFKSLLMPFRVKSSNGMYLPNTIIKAGANFQNRVNYYNISAFNVSMGYAWRSSRTHSQEFNPFDLSYVKTSNISHDFYDLMALNPSLALSLQDQFIVGCKYTYTINQQASQSLLGGSAIEQSKPHSYVFRGGLEQAGNLLEAVMKQANEGEDRPYKILGSPYAQYIKSDLEYRYHWTLNRNHKIATNLITGVGYSYGNASSMPYVKLYSIGGASSLRAFPARTVGPGTYNVVTDPKHMSDSITFTDQYADIKLQGNAEYRFGIYKFLKGAFFVDAGNIWTLREDSTRIGSQFKFNTFYKQLAVGTGIGIRLDFNVFLVRFDIAMPIRRPDMGWVFRDMDFNNSDWRRKNIIFNIGIGYPF